MGLYGGSGGRHAGEQSEAAEENKWVVVKSKKAKGGKKIKDALKVVVMEENKM